MQWVLRQLKYLTLLGRVKKGFTSFKLDERVPSFAGRQMEKAKEHSKILSITGSSAQVQCELENDTVRQTAAVTDNSEQRPVHEGLHMSQRASIFVQCDFNQWNYMITFPCHIISDNCVEKGNGGQMLL